MNYVMQLDPDPFERMREGSKTIELRLNDEKRRRMHVGDHITFLNRGNASRSVTVRVVALHPFSSFEELYHSLPLEKCGYTTQMLPTASAHDMSSYYSHEEELRYGVVGIEVALLT